jgi:hypothetical protein
VDRGDEDLVVTDASEALARAAAKPRKPRMATDADRVAALPRVDPTVDVDAVSARYLTQAGREAGVRLRPAQARALEALRLYGGLLGPIGTGHGKSLITLLAPVAAGAARPLLLIPANMRVPLANERTKFAEHWRLAENLKVLSYSMLSVESGANALEEYAPDLIIADEAHNLRHLTSARSKRLIRYFQAHPETRFAALSGTLTARSVKDYAHLSELSLRAGSPLPLERFDLEAWSRILDSDQEPQGPTDYLLFQALLPEWRNLNYERRAVARKRFSERLNATPGVVATSDASIGASLLFEEVDVPPCDHMREALKELEKTWTRPDGEELPDAMSTARVGKQLSVGFYYRWAWRNGEPDLDWLTARNRWAAWVRFLLLQGRPDLDSPLRVRKALEAGRLVDPRGRALLDAWAAQEHKPEPDVEPVWISDVVVRRAVQWAVQRLEEGVGGIVWYHDRAVGERLASYGLPLYDAGRDAPVTWQEAPVFAASITAHGTGKNLQPWAHNLILSWPASGSTAEQLISRTHRAGQKSDEVYVDYIAHTRYLKGALFQSQRDARYIEASLNTPQRICYGSWLNGPVLEPEEIPPPEVTTED